MKNKIHTAFFTCQEDDVEKNIKIIEKSFKYFFTDPVEKSVENMKKRSLINIQTIIFINHDAKQSIIFQS